MAYTICHASIDERGSISNGAAGDQTGREVCTRNWYSKPWSVLLRHPDAALGAQAALIAKKLAACNLVGYDQGQRNSLYRALAAHGWDVDAYILSGEKTEADCSSFVYACYCCLIPEIRSDSNAPTTSTMQSKYKTFGFKVLTAPMYLESPDYLMPGDILVKPAAHTVMCCDVGAKVIAPASPSAEDFAEIIASELNVRSGPGTDHAVIGSLRKGRVVRITNRQGNWYQSPDAGGWISNSWVKHHKGYSADLFRSDVCALLGASSPASAHLATPTISASKNKHHALVTPIERYFKCMGYYSGAIEADAGKKASFGSGMTAAVNLFQHKDVGYAQTSCDGELTAKGKSWKKLLGL